MNYQDELASLSKAGEAQQCRHIYYYTRLASYVLLLYPGQLVYVSVSTGHPEQHLWPSSPLYKCITRDRKCEATFMVLD